MDTMSMIVSMIVKIKVYLTVLILLYELSWTFLK